MKIKTALLFGVLLFGGCASPLIRDYVPPVPDANGLYEMDIEEMPLARALIEWAVQTGYEIVIPDDAPGIRETSGRHLTGRFSPEESLLTLIGGRGLRFECVGKLVIIRAEQSPYSYSRQ